MGYFGARFEAEKAAFYRADYTCAACGVLAVRVFGRGTGTAMAPYFLGGGMAKASAARSAAVGAHRDAMSLVRFAPCPICGRRPPRGWLHFGWPIAVVASMIATACWASIAAQLPPAVPVLIALFGAGYVALRSLRWGAASGRISLLTEDELAQERERDGAKIAREDLQQASAEERRDRQAERAARIRSRRRGAR